MKRWVGIVDWNESTAQNKEGVFKVIELNFNIEEIRIEYTEGDPIQKSLLPRQKLHSLICIPKYEFQLRRKKESREAYLLHFDHCIVAYSTEIADEEPLPNLETKIGTYKTEQVVWIEGENNDFVSALLLIKPDKKWAHIFKIKYDEDLGDDAPLQLNILTQQNFIKVSVNKPSEEKGVFNVYPEKPIYDLNKNTTLVNESSQIRFNDEAIIVSEENSGDEFHISKLYGQEMPVESSDRYKLITRDDRIQLHTAFFYCKLNEEYILDVSRSKYNTEDSTQEII